MPVQIVLRSALPQGDVLSQNVKKIAELGSLAAAPLWENRGRRERCDAAAATQGGGQHAKGSNRNSGAPSANPDNGKKCSMTYADASRCVP
jgi:hypothetical protein